MLNTCMYNTNLFLSFTAQYCGCRTQ